MGLNDSSNRVTIRHIDVLTVVRGLAAWWVVFYHFKRYLQPYLPEYLFLFIGEGDLAVDLFFWLSGFVMFISYGSMDPKNIAVIKGFIINRISRVYPLHLFIIILYALLVYIIVSVRGHIGDSDRFTAISFMLNVLLVHNWGLLDDLTWNVPSWSISVEFFAYLCFPLFVFLLGRRTVIWSLLLLAVIIIMLALVFSVQGVGLGNRITQLGLFRCVTQFFGGMILAHIWSKSKVGAQPLGFLLFLSASIIIICGFYLQINVAFFVPSAWMLLIFAMAIWNFSSDSLFWKILVYIGQISYSTYMFHYIIYDLFKIVFVSKDHQTEPIYLFLCFFAVLLVSIFGYEAIEKPAQRYIRRVGRNRASTKSHIG